MADEKSSDKGSFALDSVFSIAEGGLIGTFAAVLLTALSNLPVVLISAVNAPYVALAVGAIVALKGINDAYTNFY